MADAGVSRRFIPFRQIPRAPAGIGCAPVPKILFRGEDCLSEASFGKRPKTNGARAWPSGCLCPSPASWGHARTAPMVLGPFAEGAGMWRQKDLVVRGRNPASGFPSFVRRGRGGRDSFPFRSFREKVNALRRASRTTRRGHPMHQGPHPCCPVRERWLRRARRERQSPTRRFPVWTVTPARAKSA